MAAHECTTAKFSPITPDSVHCPQKRLWLLILPTAFPNTCSLTSHEMSFAVLPVSDWVSTPFALRPQHGTPGPSLPVICADDAVQDEQHAIFHCTQPHTVSLRRRYESLFSEARAQDVSTLTHESNNTIFFLHEPIVINEQALVFLVSWVSRKVLILTAYSAKQVRCPIFSIGSDASYDSGTVYSLQTILFLIKLCRLTLFQIEVILDLSGSARNPRFPCISAISECHTISRIYPSKTVWAHFARTYHRELKRAWQFDTTWWSPFQQNYEDLSHTFWWTFGDCSWLVGWQKKKS